MNQIMKLLEKPFSKLSQQDKLEVKRLGRPRPDMEMRQSVNSLGGKGPKCFNRVFSVEYYDKFDWLSGCEIKNRLYCFPCVLFRGDRMWSLDGFTDLNHLAYKGKHHENSRLHIQNVISYAFIGKGNIANSLSDAFKKGVIKHNKKVDENRQVLSALINCIKFCDKFEIALKGYGDGQTYLNQGIFQPFVNFSAEIDSTLKTHIEKSAVFSSLATTIQKDILECMLIVCQNVIKREIKEADCFSVIIEDTSDTFSVFQIAIIYRYIINGRPVERFYRFLQPSENNSEALSNVILPVLNEVNQLKNKLIGQTYDGAFLMNGVHDIIKEIYPNAHFVHCYSRHLNLVITKALSINCSVRVFFANLTELCNFFAQSPQRMATFNEFVQGRRSESFTASWNSNSCSINTVFETKDDILEFLINLRDQSLNHAIINQATGFVKILEDPCFNFWLQVCHPLMAEVDTLYFYFQKGKANAKETLDKIVEFENRVYEIRNGQVGDDEEPQYKRIKTEDGEVDLKKDVIEICDIIIMEVRQRFSYTGHMSAATLLDRGRFALYRNEFPRDLMTEVAKDFELDEVRLKTELDALYLSELAQVWNALELVNVIYDNHLSTTLKEVNRLSTILATSPISSEPDSSFSTLKKVKAFLRNTTGHSSLNALAMLSIENDLVHRTYDFNARVIDYFAAMKDRKIDLNYK